MSGLWKTLRRALLSSAVAISLAAGSITAAPGAHGQDASGPVYEVQAGDTLASIAQQFGLSLDDLMAANPGVDPAALPVGRQLVIPGMNGVTGRLTTHPLEPGETLDSLSVRLGFKRESLVRLNHVINPERLYLTQNVVLTDQPDAGPGVATGRVVEARAGQGWLSAAATARLSPWAVAAENDLPHPWLASPGQRLAVAGGDAPLKGLPAVIRSLDVSPAPAAQGQTLTIKVVSTEPVSVSARLDQTPIVFGVDAADPLTTYGLVGVYRLLEPNLYPLTITMTDTTGAAATLTQSFPIRAGRYVVDPPLTVDPATVDPEAVRPEFERVRAIVTAPPTPERLWNGPFALPSVGVIRSVFGALRSYNGGPYDSFHGGVDFSGAEDRPITAPAPGIVVMTEPLTVRGNATIIDHGWGVYTGYWHQSSFQVEVGQRVETGQVIGFQGATGRVTGPHLHWEIFVSGVQVDPFEWTERAFP
jgi:murein DD-endopeptidase MepM/ murein hydrolase activator NlpD